jgi:hypothetical protein
MKVILYREEGITLSRNGDIICCWHPPPKYPYELSQPIPRYMFYFKAGFRVRSQTKVFYDKVLINNVNPLQRTFRLQEKPPAHQKTL